MGPESPGVRARARAKARARTASSISRRRRNSPLWQVGGDSFVFILFCFVSSFFMVFFFKGDECEFLDVGMYVGYFGRIERGRRRERLL